MAPLLPKAPVDPYVDVMNRLHGINTGAVTCIGLLTLLSVWGDRTAMALCAFVMIVLSVGNAWITKVLLRRTSVSTAETVRLVLNLGVSLPAFHMIHWPLPVWLYLPFTALAFDKTNHGVALRVVAITCAAETACALYDGVPLLQPTVFVVFTAIAWNISKVRQVAHAQLATNLRQAQKLEAVGGLAAGIAHEINTPLQYSRDNVRFLEGTMHELLGLIHVYRNLHEKMTERRLVPSLLADARRAEEEADLPYLLVHAQEACHDSSEGLDRIAAIVASMRYLAHPQQIEMSELDLNAAIAKVLVVATHEYKYVADVETQFADLPPVMCHPGSISQALLNIVVNAAHAIADAKPMKPESRGRIAVSSACAGDDVVIEISDNGPGISEAVQGRVFEPFFTTKDVGRGTGQGLAIARSIAEQHGGALTFVSEVGRGTTFSLRLPLRGKVAA